MVSGCNPRHSLQLSMLDTVMFGKKAASHFQSDGVFSFKRFKKKRGKNLSSETCIKETNETLENSGIAEHHVNFDAGAIKCSLMV